MSQCNSYLENIYLSHIPYISLSFLLSKHIFTAGKLVPVFKSKKKNLKEKINQDIVLQNCKMECFSHAMEQECGCVMYFMPRLNANTKICTRANFDCYNPLRISLERGENLKYSCSCLPPCNSLSYSGDVSATPFMPPHLNPRSSLSNFSAESRM